MEDKEEEQKKDEKEVGIRINNRLMSIAVNNIHNAQVVQNPPHPQSQTNYLENRVNLPSHRHSSFIHHHKENRRLLEEILIADQQYLEDLQMLDDYHQELFDEERNSLFPSALSSSLSFSSFSSSSSRCETTLSGQDEQEFPFEEL